MSGVRIYAHRGASAELPENTMAAFRRAVELGVDALGYRGPTALSRAEAASALAFPAMLRRGPFRCRAQRAQLPLSLGKPWVVARMKALGLAVDFWTVDDPELARRLVAMGADGIMT